MFNYQKCFLLLPFLFLACSSTKMDNPYDYADMDRATRHAYRAIDASLQKGIHAGLPVKLNRHSRIDTIIVSRKTGQIGIALNQHFGNIPFREENTAAIYGEFKNSLGRKFEKYSIEITVAGRPIDELIPNFYRSSRRTYDRSRMPGPEFRSYPLVRNMNKAWQPSQGLYNRNIALWHSHGWYYEQKLDRWEWQRARVFQTVEDLLPLSFTLQYLVPMLENAGAQVFLPRERDTQINEIVVDNDAPLTKNSYQEYANETNTWYSPADSGFAIGSPPYQAGDNPFWNGTYRSIYADTLATAKIRWLPKVSEPGTYGVYISYASSDSNVTDAHYSVYHAGGKTDFLVNQQMGGATWIYLGAFDFHNSPDMDIERVELTNLSQESGKVVSGDAVRFGGGVGNVTRNGQVSGRPRFTEAARYYLQYAGMPDTLVFSFNEETSDYRDDYQCRAEWVNYLRGAPYGPNRDRMAQGLKIPIDLSFAFHTDAGFTRNDTVIGTLSIYSSEGFDDSLTFPDGMSRLANRDFADIMQTQIVDDIRQKYDPAWNRRMLWDRSYSENSRPNVPSVLLELLSHHNFLDMKFALDPRFRFDVSRSIYKAMVKFLASQWQIEYTIQPLPVTHFQVTFNESGQVALDWEPVADPLEETAQAKKYILYTRVEDEAFDNGILIEDSHTIINSISPGIIYSFKVTAINEGGESFPSEILSLCKVQEGIDPVLIVNGFDRVSAAASIETSEYLGFADFWDEGVPDKYDLNYIGTQYDFLAKSPWLDDDAPGHGSSHGDYETTIISGNTFDFPYLHGQSIRAAGYSFVSVSDEAVMEGYVDITDYKILDLILGEEKEVSGPKSSSRREFRAFPKDLQNELTRYCQLGGNLFVSGAYVGSDLFDNSSDSLDIKFGQEVLKYDFRTDHAVKTGGVFSIASDFFPLNQPFEFNTSFRSDLYKVESPDAIEAFGPGSKTILRYSENNTSAAVAHTGTSNVIVFGFPFETIVKEKHRDEMMLAILNFFKQDN
ncbi:MAG: xanthan lyase [Candidatus Marinimicrobia bacterium]|nr:xanthan lyase [Candidatus Neomarinimicrobiota bacterium]